MLDPKRAAGALLCAAALALSVSTAGAAPPAGHGDDDEEPAPVANPHGGGGARGPAASGKEGANGMFQPPEDGATDAANLPLGVLEILIADPMGKPMPNAGLTLGIVYNTVAKGESRKHVALTTNAEGIARVEHLETGSGVAYRPTVNTDGATFAVAPFRMPDKGGMRAILHVYPVVESIDKALIVAQSILYVEVKDDRVQIQQLLKVYNFGKAAWVPKDFIMTLPEEFTAFTSEQGMTDVGVDSIPKKGVKVRGTFSPGEHQIEFRWQLPYEGTAEVHFEVGMAPHTAASRVIAPASKDMTLDVPGFPAPQSTNDGQGQRALVTEKQLKRDDQSLKHVEVVIRGLPTEGPAKIIATLLSALGVGLGLVFGTRKPSTQDKKAERDRLLLEIEDLERAKLAGDIGPKTYDRARRELLDALARTFTVIEEASASTRSVSPAKKKARA